LNLIAQNEKPRQIDLNVNVNLASLAAGG